MEDAEFQSWAYVAARMSGAYEPSQDQLLSFVPVRFRDFPASKGSACEAARIKDLIFLVGKFVLGLPVSL